MTAHPVTLKVSANVPKDCSFSPEDDSWNGVCEELSLTVRGNSFSSKTEGRRRSPQGSSATSRALVKNAFSATKGRPHTGRLLQLRVLRFGLHSNKEQHSIVGSEGRARCARAASDPRSTKRSGWERDDKKRSTSLDTVQLCVSPVLLGIKR
jgi:hypothetical protein